jgi:hypothetical protein
MPDLRPIGAYESTDYTASHNDINFVPNNAHSRRRAGPGRPLLELDRSPVDAQVEEIRGSAIGEGRLPSQVWPQHDLAEFHHWQRIRMYVEPASNGARRIRQIGGRIHHP